MEDFLFATVLFLFYFCFACCLLYRPAYASAVVLQHSGGLKANDAPLDVEQEVVKQAPSPVPQVVSGEERQAAPQPIEQLISPLPLDELLGGIDLDRLRLRPARKIASKLGIAQKVNGKDQPLAWLRAQIKKQLQEKPEEAIPVIKNVLSAA